MKYQSTMLCGDISGGYSIKTPCISKDEPVIKADNEADRQKFYECFYKQEPIEPNNKKCNLTFCRYNTDKECTNDEQRKACAEASRKVLYEDENDF